MIDTQKEAVKKINRIVFFISLGVTIYVIGLIALYLNNP